MIVSVYETNKPVNIEILLLANINGSYYSGLQQAHSTTPHEAPHSAGAHAPQTVPPPQTAAPPPVSVVAAAPPPGIPHGLVSKSVS